MEHDWGHVYYGNGAVEKSELELAFPLFADNI